MTTRSTIGICFLLGFSLLAIDLRPRAEAAEPLPDASLLAYARRPKPPPQPKVSQVYLTGTIISMESNGLKIKASKTSSAKDQSDWLVAAGEGTEVTILGTAEQDYLRKGQVIEFSAEVVTDEKSTEKVKAEKVASPVSELTIVSRKKSATTSPSSSKKSAGAKDKAPDAGIGGRIEAGKPAADPDSNLAADDAKDAAKPAGGAAKKKKEAVDEKPKIVARVESVGSKSITVTAGERTIRIELDESPTIKLELLNPKIIPDADISKTKIEGAGAGGKLVSLIASDLKNAKIVVHGTGVESQTDKSNKQCAAKSIVVTLANSLKGPAGAIKTASDK